MHVMISCGDINGIATDIFFRTFTKHVFPDMQFSIAINEDTAREVCEKWNLKYADQCMHFESLSIVTVGALQNTGRLSKCSLMVPPILGCFSIFQSTRDWLNRKFLLMMKRNQRKGKTNSS